MHDVALVTASTADSRCTTVDSNAAETLMQIKISKFFDFWAGDISGSLNGIHSPGSKRATYFLDPGNVDGPQIPREMWMATKSLDLGRGDDAVCSWRWKWAG